MRALKYLKNRFEFCLMSRRPLYIGQGDVNALNQIIEMVNKQQKDTNLDDALLLFYVLSNWKVHNQANSLMLKERDDLDTIMKIPDIYFLFQKLCLRMNSKDLIIDEITAELQIHQEMNKVPKNELIKKEEVRELLEQALSYVKDHFKPISTLSNIKRDRTTDSSKFGL